MSSYNWENKQQRSLIAKNHTIEMDTKFRNEIEYSINNSKIYSDFINPPYTFNITSNESVQLHDLDSVSEIFNSYKDGKKIAVLNFASYKNPGGMFINGSRAQEECLCHESFLYNVLREFTLSFYDWNIRNKNKALYTNRAIYSPDIIFERNNLSVKCDVITCAAPNYTAAAKYANVNVEENNNVLSKRIRFILDIAASNYVNTLILGAYGCGVFGQDPYTVAEYFKYYLEEQNYLKYFDEVIFAIPNTRRDDNFKSFYSVFMKDIIRR